jgi:hypothetical protein
MPFLPASGAISINDLNTFFTGSGTAMSNFYRGGGRVPSTKTTTTTTREPASGFFYGEQTYGWQIASTFVGSPNVWIRWDGTFVASAIPFPGTSYTIGNTTYYQGPTLESFENKNQPHGVTVNIYNIYREVTTTNTVNINTGIPTSGQISLNQFYGAEVP